MLTYIYEDEVMLLVEITPPGSAARGRVALRRKLRWLVCEQTCVPGDGEVDAQADRPARRRTRERREIFAKLARAIADGGAPPFRGKMGIRKATR